MPRALGFSEILISQVSSHQQGERKQGVEVETLRCLTLGPWNGGPPEMVRGVLGCPSGGQTKA